VSRWIWLAAGLILGADWLRRSVAASIGMSKLPDVTAPEWDRLLGTSEKQPSVTVVVPARNEGASVEQCLRSLLSQDYSALDVCAVDDRSLDETGRIMDRLQQESPSKLRVIHIAELPAGWLGKTHAMWRGALESQSDWILFTDGDILFRPDALRRTIAYGEASRCDHLVIFPTMIMKSFGERMMLGFFSFASVLLLRAWKVSDPKTKDFIGAGAFNLIRRRAYEEVGTYQALRMEVIDDLMLGKAVKQHGFAQDCVVGPGLVSLRWADGALGVVRNLQKNMFSLLGFSWPLAVLAAFGATLYHLGPWLGIIMAPGIAKLGFGIAILSILLLYTRQSQMFRVSAWFFLTQPIASVMFVYTLLNSAISSVVHGGVLWRGTTYRLDEIRTANELTRRAGEERRRRLVDSSYTGPERRSDPNRPTLEADNRFSSTSLKSSRVLGNVED
jgi:glycosyltransferase involved in cell wall biosynthesis